VVQKEALAAAITEMIWTAGTTASGEKKCVLCLLGSEREHQVFSTAEYAADGITERIKIHTLRSREQLHSQVTSSISSFTANRGPGVLLLLYSVVLSRGIAGVIEDMDMHSREQPLVGHHGYANQELVNLMTVGQAFSNVFNGVKSLGGEDDGGGFGMDGGVGGGDSIELKGIPRRSKVGLLSLFEVYRSVQVGSFLKAPEFPVWIICSESHYTVAAAPVLYKAAQRRQEQAFDLFYYDGLAMQHEEDDAEPIRLTVDPHPGVMLTPAERGQRLDDADSKQMVPPLDLCIRTRWKNATVDWNGVEKLL
jgi:hypothetical protein